MDLTKEWYRSEFISHEMLEEYRDIENELHFYNAITNGDKEYIDNNIKNKTFTNPDGMGLLSENPLQNIRYHFVVTTATTSSLLIVRRLRRYGLKHNDFKATKVNAHFHSS